MTPDLLALSNVRPELSAKTPLTRCQGLLMLTALTILAVAIARWPLETAKLFVFFATTFYLVFTAHKLVLVRTSIHRKSEIVVTQTELDDLNNHNLPTYSILVPLYREPESIAQVVKAIRELDYPDDKKDVQLLLEEDDTATREAAENIELPPGFRLTIVPKSFPRTKPKACNLGLEKATGQYLVIYDAEDRPEPDQLKKAVAAFNRAPPNVICLQSRLNFYNPRQNLLTRWFTAEYCAWFDLSLPGLSAIGAVIPLGGTSNHFVTQALRELLGWDAYNVTEDCDLGIRIYRVGYRSVMLHTTTWEEACSSWHFWIRQRTRWLKGYIQTYFVHMRRPLQLLRQLGFMNFIHFQILIGGIIFSFLINPLFWILALLWFFFRMQMLTSIFPGPVFAMGTFCLFVGNFVFVYVSAIACYRRKYFDLVKYALLSPFYWIFMSYSGWRALLQFFVNPFTWEKTRHGLFRN